ncbi:MAG TPA: hypothetical protein VD794_16015 [Flavisolibacter sp.]|nr:hypothetical protein [Flavisolibacter sp.]
MSRVNIKIALTVISAFIAVYCLFQLFTQDFDRGAGWLWAGLIIFGGATGYAIATGFKSNGVNKYKD